MDFGTPMALLSVCFVLAVVADLYLSGLYYEPVRVKLIILGSLIGLISHMFGDLKALAAVLIQPDRFGTSIVRTSRVYSESLRTKHRRCKKALLHRVNKQSLTRKSRTTDPNRCPVSLGL